MEEIYVNVENAKPVDTSPSAAPAGPRSSERRFLPAVILCLGLLCLCLLAGLIGLTVHYRDLARDSAIVFTTVKANFTEHLQARIKERDVLNASLTELSQELDRLQSLFKQKKTCPAGWRMFHCSCYFLSTVSDSWENGRRECRDRGADLVIIDTYEEQEFLTNFVRGHTWIGLNDRDNEGTWKWTDGSPLTDAYWNGKPDNGGGDPRWGEEDCVEILASRQTRSNWNDLRCEDSLPWICEKIA
ncbi:CD209 antigen-like protein E [Plectropomus leopardus]|uniref:CD209 antigen-like protein E n=1 Tax=Plectropomus leopardus TaxID=160734 RepID=UPI001C4D3B29|nr:CD209 antigen-like protein E [Plectropomus leopardus]